MNKKNYTFIKVLATWGNLLAQTAKQWRIFVSYALVATLVSAVSGLWSFACKTPDYASWCVAPPQNIYLLYIYFIVFYGFFAFLLGAFVVDIYKGVSENGVFKLRDIFSLLRSKIKMTTTLLTILFSVFASVYIAFRIIDKPANPNFDIEFCYFLITFTLLLIPLFMIRCSTCFAYYVNTGHFAARKVYDNTSGCSYISVMQLLLLVIFCLIVNINFIGYFSRITQTYKNLTTALSVDFVDTLLKLVYFAAILMLFQAQYVQMEKDEEQKREIAVADNESEADSEEEDIATPKITAKAASKKKYKRKAQTKQKAAKKQS